MPLGPGARLLWYGRVLARVWPDMAGFRGLRAWVLVSEGLAAGLGGTGCVFTGWMPDLAGGVGEAGAVHDRGAGAAAPAQGPEPGAARAAGSGDEVARLDDQGGGVFGCLAGDVGQDRDVGVGGQHDAGVPELVLDGLQFRARGQPGREQCSNPANRSARRTDGRGICPRCCAFWLCLLHHAGICCNRTGCIIVRLNASGR
jgi:hypothetical protein